jgi:hypothetical protein
MAADQSSPGCAWTCCDLFQLLADLRGQVMKLTSGACNVYAVLLVALEVLGLLLLRIVGPMVLV